MNKKKRSQTALEFLMTYGWAILVMLVVIGALSYYGVLSPEKYVPQTCTLEAGLLCEDFEATDQGIVLLAGNHLGHDIKVETIAIPKTNCMGVFNISLPNGERKIFNINCDLSEWNNLRSDIEFVYSTPEGLEHNTKGMIVILIKKKTTPEQPPEEDEEEPQENQTCSDGTSYEECSVTKPLYCDNGILVNNCNACSCEENYTCQINGSCEAEEPPSPPEEEILSENCTGSSGFDCLDNVSISDRANTIDFTLKNNIGYAANISSTVTGTDNCATPPAISVDGTAVTSAGVTVANNEKFVVKVICEDIIIGRFESNITLRYINMGTGVPQQATINIIGEAR